MDPEPNPRNPGYQLNPRSHLRQSASAAPGGDRAAQQVDGATPETGEQPAVDRQPQHLGAFTVIPPNQSRRNEMKAMAQKEEEELQRYREAHKPPPLDLNPERLGGGDVTEAEARERQFADLRFSRIQKKLKKEEMDKKRKEEEEAELQKMKAKQREKAERLEQKSQQEEQRRRMQFQPDHTRKMETFLQGVERSAAASSSAARASSTSKEVDNQETKIPIKSMKELQLEHKRVNQAFLDKLESKKAGTELETNKCFSQEEEPPRLGPGDSRRQTTTGRDSLTHLEPDPEQSRSNWTEETDPERDHDWNLMKLMNNFPDCNREFLEDILNQCNGDYQQAYTLLICTLN
ncbi:epithelial-stromal interaction protein 1 isoform X1 [Fundulus heteroclitus]|uniref:epithelial-stromal interaction protein 1 isoform X1 n=1 Tax=Fundulus heteroclitus TaxID=8078 RepID=UPI00165C2C9F|nr:epithelial-stromal interaction protein 1 isoform X1 [Fundulus heteroclitus]